MPVTVEEFLAGIETHTRGLAAAASGRLEAPVEHCPGWSTADLVWHLTEVHRFWEWVARTLPSDEPAGPEPVDRPPDDALVAALLVGMGTLIDTLRAADQQASCWTWGLEQNVGFITRHQVQEAAVHHWDAVQATGSGSWAMAPALALDAIEEFLTHSAANTRWPMPGAEPMAGTFWFQASVPESTGSLSWHVFDGDLPGTLAHRMFSPGEPVPGIEGPAIGGQGDPRDLLLWLYGRLGEPPLAGLQGDRTILDRFQAFTNTS